MTQPIDIQRKLAAILAADVEGFARLTELDEETTLKALAAQRAIFDAAIERHRGRIANTAGDSVLAEFPSVTDAVRCAVEAQQLLGEAVASQAADRRVLFRIGIHLGDVVVRGVDLLGNGVNIAARLQSVAQASGVVLSAAAHDQVRKSLPYAFADLGPQRVKNLDEPVQAFALQVTPVTSAAGATAASALFDSGKPLPLPDKPSIAVLPFQNMSGDPEQEYFADGMVEDIITALSRFKSLFVIARNSSFTYKGKTVDIKQVGRELGVRYVLEGSVRKAGGRVRITGQLIDSTSGGHVWADRFDGSLDDVFDLQDKITEQVVGVIAPRVERAEVARLRLVRTDNPNAYDLSLRALESMRLFNAHGFTTAIELCRKAIALDPTFATAYGVATQCFGFRRSMSLMQDEGAEISEGTEFAKQAVATGQDDAFALAAAAFFFGSVHHEMDLARELAEKAIAVNPNLVEAWRRRGYISVWIGQHDAAIEQLETALRLSPMDPDVPLTYQSMSNAYLYLGKYEDALHWSTKALSQKPELVVARRMAIAASVAAGNLEEARRMMVELRGLEPNMTISRLRQTIPARRPEDRALMFECMRQAGMPE